MQLNVVLLPEPFGPISPRISPSLTSNETLFTARRAPNLLVRPETVSIGMGRLPSARVPDAVHRGSGTARTEMVPGQQRITSCCAAPGTWTSLRVRVPLRQRKNRLRALDLRRPHDVGLAVDELHHNGNRTFVLSRHRRTGPREFH